MLNHVISFSVRNKLLIGIFTLGLIAWGVYNFIRLPIDAVPDITNNQVQVITISPSLAPQEVEQFITFPVEVTMANLQNVTEIRSISRFGLSVVTIVFKDNVDIYLARQMVSEQIKIAEQQIPENYGKPEMMPVTTGLGEIFQYVVEPKPGYEKVYSSYDIRSIQDWIIKRQLAGIPGIVDISTFGGLLKQYEVAIDPKKLVGMNITITEIFDALERNNQNSGGSYIEKRQDAYYIRTEGIIRSNADIGQIVIKKISGIPILVRDVAEVKIGAPPRFGAMTMDGKGEAVGGITLMLKGANSSQVIKSVKERMDKVQRMLPAGLEIKPYLDRSQLISKTISTVTKNLVEGGLIVIFVLVLLLGNFRSGMIVASVIPLSMLFAISMMNVFGVSANLMSLGAIDFGLIVDGSVIVVEGMLHHLQKHFNLKQLNQQEMDDTVKQSAIRISRSAVFGVLIILIVYLPIFAFTGIEGKMFRPMAQTVSFALIGALILSFTYVPMISSMVLKKKVNFRKNISDRIMNVLHRHHDRVLEFALKHTLLTVAGALVVVIISLYIFTRMGGEFLPTLEEGDLACQMTVTPGTSLSQSIATTTRTEKILLEKFPEVIHVVSKIGSAEIPTDPMAIEDADIMITMKPKEEWTSARDREEMSEKMKEALAVIPGATFDFSQPIQLRFNELMTGVKSDVAIKIFGEDLDILYEKANQAASLINDIEGAGDVRVEQIVGLPQIVVHYRRDKVAQYGLNISDINSIVRACFAGESAGLVFEGEKRFDLVVRLDEDYRKNIQALQNLRINRPDEELILLSQVADINIVKGPMQISREETKRRATIGINVRNRDIESFVNEVSRTLESKISLPPGYYFTYGGQFENLKTAKRTSAIAVPVALAAIFILLFFAFSSFKQSVMIFTAIPLAAVGGIWALLLRGMPFSISAGVGFIALFGIAVLNGIVLISHYNELEKEGFPDILSRIRTGTSDRLRPVIMTSLVAALGFVPMALSTAAGAEVQKPLATVVIGGIITSSLLTLIVLPVLYLTFNQGFTFAMRDILPWKKIRKAAPILILLIIPMAVFAQEDRQKRILTVQDALQIAREHNPLFRNPELMVKAQKSLIKSGIDIPSPELLLEKGQINTPADDYKLTVSQSFDFPVTYVMRTSAAKAGYEAAKALGGMEIADLNAEVRKNYCEWWTILRKYAILIRQDSLVRVFHESVKKQYQMGEIGDLELLLAESRALRMRDMLDQVETEVTVVTGRLKNSLGVRDEFRPPDGDPLRLPMPAMDTVGSSSLQVNYLEQKYLAGKRALGAESWDVAPSFSVGWFTQSLDQDKGYSGWQAGISVPLWFWVPMGKIQSARHTRDIAWNNLEYGKNEYVSKMTRLRQELLRCGRRLEYYEKSALPHADLLLNGAWKSFRSGEIDLFGYILSMNEAFDIRSEYLDALNDFNNTVIEIEKNTWQ